MSKIELDWGKLSFAYMPTNYNVRCYFKNDNWGELEISSSETINMHMSATCLHYGQEIFEGLKAFRGKDNKIRLFRWEENWKRLNLSAEGISMPTIPKEVFKEALFKAINLNEEFVPPYGTGASLYIRPLMIGTGAKIGVAPTDEYLLVIFVTPVGPYFPQGFKGVDVQIVRDHDRAAPLGTGRYKTGGNYAAALASGQRAAAEGFKTVLYLDAKEKKYIDECGPANFFGIKGDKYITPESSSILESITNKSLCAIAEDLGLTVERRKVPEEELKEFEEAGACGTAAVITPIKRIVDRDTKEEYKFGDEPGKWSTKLYNRLISIQCGDAEDKFKWITIVD